MQIKTSDIIDAPVAKVYQLVRDDLPKLVEFLPNIRKIETIDHNEDGANHKVVNHWYAKAELPSMIKKFLNEDLFSWEDIASWSDKEHQVVYSIKSFIANDLFEAEGKNEFVEVEGGAKTQLRMTCDITIHADKVPGVPKMFAKKVVPMVENLLSGMLEPNLSSLGKGLQSYFQSKAH